MDSTAPTDEALREAATAFGVQQEFWDIFGRQHRTSADTNQAILTAVGMDCSSTETLRQSMARRREKGEVRLLPPVLVVSENEPMTFLEKIGDLQFEVIAENGERHIGPGFKLPLGYHELRVGGSPGGDRGAFTTRLIVTPDRAVLPSAEKQAGLGVMLYGLRSNRNWGCGDFRDLRELIDWAVPALRVSFIALNPLHAIHNRRPYNTSPYLPNSIFYRNFLYLDVEAIPGFDRIRQRFEDGETRAARVFARESPTVEYEIVASLKRRALEMIFDACPPARDCQTWIEEEGALLRLYATYCALDEHLHAANSDLWVWPDWPEEYRDPASPAVHQFAAEHETEILFHGWLQWQIDRQLAAVQAHALKAGMSIGLYHDLALATDRCGSDLWAHRAFFVPGCRVGSPPDDFSPTGQDWSFPPPNSEQHREDGYRLFTQSIRKTLRHGGALRIDHVMRLFRLFWIPPGHDPMEGAYVRDHPEDLVRILALESVRNNAVIIGEDLGTVEPEVRETLARFGILSYRLFYFERIGDTFRAPSEYPAQALVSTTTHDLPTITGFWEGIDIAARLGVGAIDEASFQAQSASRAQDKQRLLDALFAAHLLPDSFERRADLIPELTGELHYAIMGYLATTPSALWLVNQEDMTKEPEQQNLPGTTSEYPNWSRKMHWSLEDLKGLADAKDCVAMIRHWIDATGRAHG